MDPLFVLLALAFLLGLPALVVAAAIAAYVRARRLQGAFDRLSQRFDDTLANRLAALESRLAALESGATGAMPSPAAPSAVTPEPESPPPWEPTPAPPHAPIAASVSPRPPAPRGTPAPAPAPAGPPPPPPPMPPAGRDWETLIAGRWMNLVGIAALLFATGFFLLLAFQNDWIGPAGQVALSITAGIALLVFSQWLLGRGHRYFSEGIAGLGGGVLYLSIYAAWSHYRLFPQTVSFFGIVAVTLGLMLLAAGRRSVRIALLALAGGFLTPVLFSTDVDRQLTLFSYLAALNAGLLVLAWLRRWRLVEPLAFVATQAYFWGWYGLHWAPEKLLPTALFATLFFLLFSALPLLRLRRAGALAPEQLVLVLTNAFAYLVALRAVLWPDHRWTLTLAVLALAALHLLVARGIPRAAAGVSLERLLYAGLALTFATLAVPIRLDGRWVTIAWAIEGAVLVWSGFAGRLRPLRAAGLGLLGIALFRLLAFPIAAERFLLNPRFMTLAIAAACFAAAAWFGLRGREPEYFQAERHGYLAAAVVANLLLVWALSADLWQAVTRLEHVLGTPRWDAGALALALLWVLYGTALVAIGFVRAIPGLRWQGLPPVAVGAVWLLLQFGRQETWLWNPRFLVYVLTVLCVAGVARLARRAEGPLPAFELWAYRGAPILVNLLLLVALSHEVWDLFGGLRTVEDVHLGQSMGLSLLWALYAMALILIGARRASPLLRWMGIVLLAMVVLKVFLSDLAFLERAYRILSFLVLGVALLAVSFLYTRRLARMKSEGAA